MASPFVAKKELITIAKRLYDRKLVVGTDGSLSVRLDGDRFFATPSGISMANLEADDPALVDQNGKQLQGKRVVTHQFAAHGLLYRHRPDIKAIAMTLPAYTTAFSVAGVRLDDEILPNMHLTVGKIQVSDHVVATVENAVSALEQMMETGAAFLLRNYALVTVGRNLDEAYNRAEMIEQYAQVLHLARQLGGVHTLPSDEYKRLELLRKHLESAWERKGHG